MYLSLQCWTSDTEKLYELAYRQGDEFLKGSGSDELQNPEWLAVRYFTAFGTSPALRPVARERRTGEEQTETISVRFDAARQNAEVVASTQGEYQDPARGLLKELLGANANSDREPKSFLEAQNRGLDSMNTFSAAMADAKRRPTKRPAPPKKRKPSKPVKRRTSCSTRRSRLIDDNTTLEDINTVRYYLCYLAYTENRTYDAAVIGEFLLKYYPNSGGARQAAQIALASYVNEYQGANGAPSGDFDRRRCSNSPPRSPSVGRAKRKPTTPGIFCWRSR